MSRSSCVWLILFPLLCTDLAFAQYWGAPGMLTAVEDLRDSAITADLSIVRRAVRENWLAAHSSGAFDLGDGRGSHDTEVRRFNHTSVLRPLVSKVFGRLTAAGATVPCEWDSSFHSSLQDLMGTKFLLAANFKDNEAVLPQIVREIWKLSSILPVGNLYVSIYESGSSNSKTGQWLAILSKILNLMAVPHRIVTEGKLQRGGEEGRIEFLPKVRNKALEPLWTPDSNAGVGPAGWPADRIIYMNDIYVCVSDFVRLMLHREDMVCALDFWTRWEEQLSELDEREETAYTLAGHSRALKAGQARSLKEQHAEWAKAQYIRLLGVHSSRTLKAIYDTWVLRDGEGYMFGTEEPRIHSEYSVSRLNAGLPFPVTTCWNGMVVLPAKPFQQGLRFRNHLEGECRASECSLVCHDLHRLGYHQIIVDPGVQLAYNEHDAAAVHADDIAGEITRTRWEDVRQAPDIDPAEYGREEEQCCNEDELTWNEGLHCKMQSFMQPNYTRTAFPGLG